MRGILAILLVIVFTLVTTVLHLYKEQDRMQARIDKCQEDKYLQVTHIKDSLASLREVQNKILAEQNQQLQRELQEIRDLKIKLHE